MPAVRRHSRFLSPLSGALLLGAALGVLTLAGASRVVAEALTPGDETKASFLFKIGSYTSWPVEAKPRPEKPLVIGVVGDSALAGRLAKLVENRSAQDRAISVRWFSEAAEVHGVHILFVPAQLSPREQMVLIEEHTPRNVLMIGESDDFCRQGGAVKFYDAGGTLRFEVNLQAVRRAELRLSSSLLQLARFTDKP